MRFGVCCGSDRLESVKKFEIYSYVEPPLFVVNGMSEKDFKRFCAKVEIRLFLPTTTSPLFGVISPDKIFKKVDLPAPFAPMIP